MDEIKFRSLDIDEKIKAIEGATSVRELLSYGAQLSTTLAGLEIYRHEDIPNTLFYFKAGEEDSFRHQRTVPIRRQI